MANNRVLNQLNFKSKNGLRKALSLSGMVLSPISRSYIFLNTVIAVAILCGYSLSESASGGILIGTSYYTDAVASSEYSAGWSVNNLFDNDLEVGWAIAGSAGNNPQGQRQGWISFTLDKTYDILNVLYASRNPSTDTMDRTDLLKIWISNTAFGVDVKNASQTNAFLTTTTGLSPTLSLSNFDSTLQTFSTGGPLSGRYVLAQFITTDTNPNSNLGGRDFLLDVQASVPEPTSIAIFGLGAIGIAIRGRNKTKTKR